MLEEDKNLKDGTLDLSPSIKDSHFPISYTKSGKLITALYMVTDIMDTTEPLRNKLRTLGAEILSDVHSSPQKALAKIGLTVSLLDIASSINLASGMNCNILKKEFVKLHDSIKEYGRVRSTWMEDFPGDSYTTPQSSLEVVPNPTREPQVFYKGHEPSRTQQSSTRIGVQKGSTLMKALSERTANLSINNQRLKSDNFELLKRQRRQDILTVLRTKPEGLTITDIKVGAKGMSEKVKALASCSEKTLQRELISMLKDGVLYKTGEKRWSKYFIKK